MPRFLPFLVLLVLAACNGRDTQNQPPDDSLAGVPAEPATKPGTLRIEGMEEPVTLARVDAPEAPFTTWMPQDDFAVEAVQDASGADVWFRWQAGGRPNPEAYVHFAFPLSGSIESLRATLTGTDGRFDREGWREQVGPPPCLWAEEGSFFSNTSQTHTGLWCASTHAGQPFYVLATYPAEYGDGFGPRLDVLLDEFRWRDTGAALQGQ